MKRILFFLCVVLLAPGVVFCLGQEEENGTITGKLLLSNGESMSRAVVFLFDAATGPEPSLGKYWRVPDVITETDDRGSFNVTAAEGRYYISAVKRNSDAGLLGPPASGDYIYPSYDGAARNKQAVYRIKKRKTTNVGTIKGAVLFDRDKHMYRGAVTAIEGTVTLPDGKPAEHAIVFAYDNVEMNGNPRYASDPSSHDGKYILRLGRPGTYYLRVRSIYGGGRPTTGSLMGSGIPSGVKVSSGTTVKGVDLVGSAFVTPGGQGK